ncbi:hypothetical protein [Halomonas sp. THAF5a]|uniref:hypothetical protein n=1 Tax=Halomonas sp. THAF5a TaxID=2587844 RepID=UPI00126902F9|nr:hypothetical protein [Halomonas sp. THAF5a]
MAIFSGVVVSGREMAQRHVSLAMDELSTISGQDLFPGSMNVVLDKPLKLESRYSAIFDHGKRFIWRARIGCRQVWIYRWKGTPFTIVEILADCRLKDALGLLDGSCIDIEIDDALVAPLDWRDRLSSFLIWGMGRKYLYYSKPYPSRRYVMRIRNGLGDGQR